jgi:signal transduction histidine kinase
MTHVPQPDSETRTLRHQVFQLKMLLDVLTEVNGSETLTQMLDGVLSIFVGTFGASGGIAFWFDETERTWRLAANRRLPEKLMEELRAWLKIREVERQEPSLFAAGELLLLPVRAREQIVGVIGLGRRLTRQPYNDADQRLLTAALQQVSLAVEKSRLLELTKLKDEFISRATHELRNPLTAIKGYLELALKDHQQVSETNKQQFIATALDSARRLNRRVDDLLSVTRIELGREELLCKPLDLRAFLHQVTDEFKPLLKEKRMKLRRDFAAAPTVSADTERLHQVVTNLLSNAVKYSPKNSKLTVALATNHSEAVVGVKDEGIGLSQQDQQRLFEKFFRSDVVRLRNIEGTGLGLTIAKSLIELHGGRIWVESEGEGQGSVFYFTLPICCHCERSEAIS